ncbi:LysM peptidoglycan-binding domain-containing protein [Halobacillus naozhouensis]|uniref:LysM peptidoglycan-binding domain-containing protein n=1 Tax=Halobacillus naozhouensis TaxID=554880 RepID=A0ABY8J0A5_9BACI|nr:LysM peptidoglycan-binding domain-containing protein [Halobacillus naozhouensis]WFT75918.1 LysM peptidoglycan-binding domain-containing protein [Halobacillus naozhouensis]
MNKKQLATAVGGTLVGASLWGTTVFADELHKVESGDTLWELSNRYGSSVSELKSWNNINSHLIFVGQSLVVNKDGSSSNESTSSNGTASTYTIKSGDTLSGIASKYNVSVSNLMAWNNLSSSLIFTGDQLSINGTSNTSGDSSEVSRPSRESTASDNVKKYTVQPGDTLSEIGSRFGVGVSSLKSWNNISGHIIYVGQTLSLKGSALTDKVDTSSNTTNTEVSNSGLIQEAKQHIGTPYQWGGESPAGFDCSGFIQYVFEKEGISLPRTVASIYADSRLDSVSNLQVGDLVFFETYKPGASHAGIYVGGNQFIHAGSSRGVEISSLSNPYWSPRYIGAKRF